MCPDYASYSCDRSKFSISSTSLLIRESVKQVSYVCCATINWAKFLHWLRVASKLQNASEPSPPTGPAASELSEGGTWSILALEKPPHGHLLTILATAVCCSAAAPLTCSITTLNSVVVLLYSKSKVSTNTNQWERALKNSNWKHFEKIAAFLSSHLTATVSSLQPSPHHVLVKGFTRLKNIL